MLRKIEKSLGALLINYLQFWLMACGVVKATEQFVDYYYVEEVITLGFIAVGYWLLRKTIVDIAKIWRKEKKG